MEYMVYDSENQIRGGDEKYIHGAVEVNVKRRGRGEDRHGVASEEEEERTVKAM